MLNAVGICTFGEKEQWQRTKASTATKISAISKYSHIAIKNGQTEVNFGSVDIGKSLDKKIILENPSNVVANFKIKCIENDPDNYFAFSVTSGTIKSNSTVEITITYTPNASNFLSNTYFDISTVSGNTVQIKCSGKGSVPKVQITPHIINFGDVLAGSTVSRVITIENTSSMPAFYQFSVENRSTFNVEKPCGIIAANSTISTSIKFAPIDAINFYRKVFCLVENQDALSVELLGTCYNDRRRPASFKYSHVENYQRRLKMGLSQYGPEQLEELIKNGTLIISDGHIGFQESSSLEALNMTRVTDNPYPSGLESSNFFYQNMADQSCVLLDEFVDFGSCSQYRMIEPRVIRIKNNTLGKMSCVWAHPGDPSGYFLLMQIRLRVCC